MFRNPQCENNFKEIVLMNDQKIPSTGNSGLLGIRESTDLTFNLYKYAKKQKHTEPDLLELLEKHDMSNKEIYLSSFYCPCISCLNKLSSFALKNPSAQLYVFCFRYVTLEYYTNLDIFVSEDDGNFYQECKTLDNDCILKTI